MLLYSQHLWSVVQKLKLRLQARQYGRRYYSIAFSRALNAHYAHCGRGDGMTTSTLYLARCSCELTRVVSEYQYLLRSTSTLSPIKKMCRKKKVRRKCNRFPVFHIYGRHCGKIHFLPHPESGIHPRTRRSHRSVASSKPATKERRLPFPGRQEAKALNFISTQRPVRHVELSGAVCLLFCASQGV